MAYLPEKLGAILYTGVSYARLGNEPQVQKCFEAAINAIDEERGRGDTSIIPVLDEYERLYREAGRSVEAARLAALSKEVRAQNPHLYYPDGAEIPWYKREDFLSTLPPLPLEFRASHSEGKGGCAFFVGAVVVFFGVAVLAYPLTYVFPNGLPRPLQDVTLFAYLILVVLGGVYAEVRARRDLRRNATESRCRLTEDSIELHAPGQHHTFRWNQLTKVDGETEPGEAEDESRSVVVIQAGEVTYHLSARFYTEQDVKLIHGICKLKSGV
jgi:hypothetical protein